MSMRTIGAALPRVADDGLEVRPAEILAEPQPNPLSFTEMFASSPSA